MKGFCKTLRKHAEKLIFGEEKEMISLTDEENKSSKTLLHM